MRKRLVNDDHVHRDAEAPSRLSQTDRLSGAIIDIALDDEEVEIVPSLALHYGGLATVVVE